MISRIKNSFKQGMSRAEITRKLQQKGYKLEYIDAVINKARRGKRFLITSMIFIVVLLSLSAGAYSFIYNTEKGDYANPLSGFKIGFSSNSLDNLGDNELNIEDIEITPDFISYLLNEVGAWKLHKNPLTLSKPIINFKIADKSFYSVITKGKIETLAGLSDNQDIEFITSKEEVVKSIMSDKPVDIFKSFIEAGTTRIEQVSSQADLYAKGYLALYNELNN